jgi:hypothetical protein
MALVALLAIMSPLIAVSLWLIFRPVGDSREN